MNKSIGKISEIYFESKKVFSSKRNVQKFIKRKYRLHNLDNIKISYDIQSGEYVKYFQKLSLKNKKKIYDPFIKNINKFFPNAKEVLDFGCGELTLSQYFFKNIKNIKKYFANDISLNRLLIGQKFIKSVLSKKQYIKFNLFCASHKELPFLDNSIDLIITNHSLEPNNTQKNEILKEMLRVSRLGLCLMEPHYEISTKKQKKRMKKFGYIKGIEKTLKKLNCTYVVKNKKFHDYKHNISSIFIVKKIKVSKKSSSAYVDYISKKKLITKNGFLYSKENFRLFPSFNKIPIFSNESEFFLPNPNF